MLEKNENKQKEAAIGPLKHKAIGNHDDCKVANRDYLEWLNRGHTSKALTAHQSYNGVQLLPKWIFRTKCDRTDQINLWKDKKTVNSNRLSGRVIKKLISLTALIDISVKAFEAKNKHNLAHNFYSFTYTSGQSYKQFTLVIYDSRVVLTTNLPILRL